MAVTARRPVDHLALTTEELDDVLKWFAPEAVLLRFDQAGIDVDDVMLELFNSCNAQPNVAHDLAAEVAASGGAVWTSNYDTLIEEAASAQGHPLATAVVIRDSDPGAGVLVKVHGSFLERRPGERWLGTDGDLAFSAPQIYWLAFPRPIVVDFWLMLREGAWWRWRIEVRTLTLRLRYGRQSRQPRKCAGSCRRSEVDRRSCPVC